MSPSEYQALVEFLGRQFAEVDQRFAVIDQRFDALTTELREFRGDVLAHFDELYRRLGRLESEYFAIVQTLRRMETLLGDEQAHRRVLAESLVRLKTELAGLQARVEALEARIGPVLGA